MYQHIMVPLDGSELAECVLDHAVAIAKGCKTPKVSIVRVVTPPHFYGDVSEDAIGPGIIEKLETFNLKDAQDYVAKTAAALKKKGFKVETAVLQGIVVDELTDFVEKNAVDLIVMATHGRSGVSRWVMGSVADKMVRTAKVPVLMVRPPGCGPQ